MAVHSSDATPAPEPRELRRIEPVIASTTLEEPLGHLLDAQARLDRVRLLVFNPSREVDSLAEHLIEALDPTADIEHVVAKMSPQLRELYGHNGHATAHVRAATGPVDRMHRALHSDGFRSALTVKAGARKLRGPLRVAKRVLVDKDPGDGIEWARATRAILRVIDTMPADTLLGNGMRGELGAGPFDLLCQVCDLLTDGAGEGTR
jgi:hypothetical protein